MWKHPNTVKLLSTIQVVITIKENCRTEQSHQICVNLLNNLIIIFTIIIKGLQIPDVFVQFSYAIQIQTEF